MAKETNLIKNEVIEFYNRIKDIYPVKKMFLYGSHATGKANEDSDIDVGVVIDLPESADLIKITSKLFHYASKIDINIEPLCILWSDYQTHEPASILSEIVHSSIEII